MDQMSDLDLKSLFTGWLDTQYEELNKKGSKVAYAYPKASEKIRLFPGQITTPRQLLNIQFVGTKLVKFLCARLKKYCAENSIPVPVEFENHVGNAVGGKRSHELDPTEPLKKKKATNWVPKRRGGSWAILVALYTRDKGRKGLRKEDIVAVAEKHCDISFTSNPSTKEYYSAWDGVKTLVKRELVQEFGRPKTFVITDEGAKLAAVLLSQEGIQSSPAQINDMSFDNGMRVSPETPAANSSAILGYERFSSPLAKRGRSQLSYSPGVGDVLELSSGEEVSGLEKESRVGQRSGRIDQELHKIKSKEPSPQKLPLARKPSVSIPTSTYKPPPTHFSKDDHDPFKRLYKNTPYDVWTADDFEIILILDNREIRSQTERDFFQRKIEQRGVKCDVRALSVGDVLWVARHKKTRKEVVLNYICERKRIDDLASSVKDGRFVEQKSRLKRSGIKNIYYLVEESGLADIQRVTDMKTSLETSISMVITSSNFYLQRFRKADDTIDWLVTMTDVLQHHYKAIRLLVLKPRSVRSQDDYYDLLQEFRPKFETRKTVYECVHSFAIFQESMVKSNMMTVKEMFVKMLMSVRGVSLEKAVMLQRYFGTPKALFEFYLRNSLLSEEEKGDLMLTKFSNEVGSRRFNKPSSLAMYEAWGKL